MRFFTQFIVSSCIAAAAGLITPSQGVATTFDIDSVASGGGGFGASLFHKATGTNPMSGGTILDFTGWSVVGTYDDALGILTATITDPNPTTGYEFTLSTVDPLKFNTPNSTLASIGSLSVDFNAALESASLPQALVDQTLTFLPGPAFQCCGSTPGVHPNSFDGSTIVLWGATHYPDWDVVKPERFGIDIKLGVTPVPLPAALPLFGTGLGLMGLFGWYRRRRVAEAV